MIYKLLRCFLPSLKSIGLSVQEKKRKTDFRGSHLEFLIGTILAIFCLQVTQMLPTKFRVNWPFGSGEEVNKYFQDGCLEFPIGTSLANFDLQVTPMLPTELQVNWPFGSGEEAKNRF